MINVTPKSNANSPKKYKTIDITMLVKTMVSNAFKQSLHDVHTSFSSFKILACRQNLKVAVVVR